MLGSTARGARLRLIDLRAMRVLGDVTVAWRGSGVATAWAGPRRLLAVVVTPGCCGAGDTMVAGVYAGRRRVVWRRPLGGLQAGERFRGGLLLVLGPRGRSVGPSQLVHVGPEGRIRRSTPLPEIRSGTAPGGSATRSWKPGLAVDRSGARAFVVQAAAPVAEVDLRALEARSHPLEPVARAADAVTGPTRRRIPPRPCRSGKRRPA